VSLHPVRRTGRSGRLPQLTDQDCVVTVCDEAHEQLGHTLPGQRLHWSVPDPVARGDNEAFVAAKLVGATVAPVG
jgi:hypothetical protein